MTLKKSQITFIALGSIAASGILTFAIQKGMDAYYGPEYRELCKTYRNIARGR